MITRDRLVRAADAVGLNAALTFMARRPSLVVLAYHRIGDATNQSFDDELFSATAENFRAQLRHLQRHFVMLSADGFLDAVQGGQLQVSRPSALITFDDGYRDNCEVAMPILRELGIPAVFFVAAGYIDRPRLTWWDRVAFVMKRTERSSLRLTYPQSMTIELRDVDRATAIHRILRAYKRTPEIDQERFFADLEEQADVSVSSLAEHMNLFMTWDHVRTLANAGMEIGAHTYDHPVLSRATEDAQRRELTHSKRRIEQEAAVTVRVMAYPVGGRDAFTTVTQGLAADAGYRAAFSYYGGVNRAGHSALFDIRREAVERDDSMPVFRYRMAAANLWGVSTPPAPPSGRSDS